MILKYLILTMLIILNFSKTLYQIQQRFKEIWPVMKATPLPEITQQPTLQQEIAQYEQLHQTKQFRKFKPDPEYSTQVLLKKNGAQDQSFYFRGRELCNVLMEVSVVHKGDHHNHDKDAISVYFMNTATSEVLFAGKVKHLKLLKYEIQSELYYLRVAYNWSKEAEVNITNHQEIVKHISINIDIDPIIISEDQEAEINDEKAAAQKMSKITNETDRIFMNSLEIWEEILNHHREFFRNQEQVYLRAYFELVIVFAVNCIEWLLLKKALRIKSII